MKNTFLVITSIAEQNNPVLRQFAKESVSHDVKFIVIGDTKSPEEFNLKGCDFYSIKRQQNKKFKLAKILPLKHYSRKNLGYLIAISKGAEIIIETDDDNLPFKEFWRKREQMVNAHILKNKGWVNVYKYFTKKHIWPRGFALENIQNKLPLLKKKNIEKCTIQQGLADKNPDVDAIYRLTLPLPITFEKRKSVALGTGSVCPFNSQNTTWFREAFYLMYLPSYCSFRMTDIWRSFVAQRIAWTCGWSILFHQSTVWQKRNEHNLLNDFKDEMSGYSYNAQIYRSLKELNLKKGINSIPENMIACYKKLIFLGVIDKKEMAILLAWLKDIENLLKK